MIFDPATTPQLKPWLLRTLEPICDAEPSALADYILALLKHNVPENEMRKELAVQLDEFLENECPGFIDTLFTVLRTKSYLPYVATPPSPPHGTKPLDTGIPIPLDGLISPSIPTPTTAPSESRSRKRSIEPDDRDSRPPAKGPRLNSDTQFSRYGRQDDQPWNERSDRQGGYRDGVSDTYRGVNGVHMNGRHPQSYQPPDQKRGICRDYHNLGYCARGSMCKFSHGEDAVVPGQFFPPMGPGIPFLPMFANGAFNPAAIAYDPHEARMDMRPTGGRQTHQRAPLLPRVQQEDGSRVVHPANATGELPVIQDLTPRDAQKQPESESQQQQQRQQQTSIPPMPLGYDQNMFAMAMGAMNGFPAAGMNMDVDMTTMDPQMDAEPPNRNGLTYRGGDSSGRPHGGRGRGAFPGEVHNFRPERHTGTTLVVEKIPQDKLSLEHVNDWFKRFGMVTNVAIDAMNAKALVSFSKHNEAHAAWKSEDAVFNNRFVKVFWHRPMEGHGQVGARMLAASAPIVASMQAKEANAGTSSVQTTTMTAGAGAQPSIQARKPTATASSSAAVLAAKQKLLEQQIAEQKTLMARLDTASPEEKKEIMMRLRKLGEEMKKPTENMTSTTSTTTTGARTRGATPTPSTSPSTPAASSAKRSVSTPAEDRERIMRERLDRELEMHNAVIAAEGESGESMEQLKAKLEKLKAEAASLGISDGGSEAWHGSGGHSAGTGAGAGAGGYRGGSGGGWYRGRGRGMRGYYRGAMRGGPPRASMKLDNRPKKLLVKGAKEEHVRAVKEWFNTTGQVESVEMVDGGDMVAVFRSRLAAEQALAKGTNIPDVGSVQVTWYTGTVPVASGGAATDSSTHTTSQPVEREPRDHPRSPPREEEVVASGWGGGDDDGDGMGMF
ncbi:hypothetical protein AX15_005697 [Amanita polypyramis BW_CC]|nr:hypothetical protein AX15_005697 [Amanita polypyramis BW_CC]